MSVAIICTINAIVSYVVHHLFYASNPEFVLRVVVNFSYDCEAN